MFKFWIFVDQFKEKSKLDSDGRSRKKIWESKRPLHCGLNWHSVLSDLDEQILELIEKKGSRDFHCKACGTVMKLLQHMKDHVEAKHIEQGIILCPFCKSCFKSRKSLRKHFVVMHKDLGNQNVMGVRCPFCEMIVKSRSTLADHLVRFHRRESSQLLPNSARPMWEKELLKPSR